MVDRSTRSAVALAVIAMATAAPDGLVACANRPGASQRYARSNFCDISSAAGSNSYDAKSAVGYDVTAAVNTKLEKVQVIEYDGGEARVQRNPSVIGVFPRG